MLNYTRVDFNIVRPTENKSLNPTQNIEPNKALKAIRTGQAFKPYGISEFDHNNRKCAIKMHETYQSAIKDNESIFRKTNGEFTSYTHNMNISKF